MAKILYRIQTKRVPVVVVVAFAFLIVAVGSMVIRRIDWSIGRLKNIVAEAEYTLALQQKEVSELASKLQLSETDDFIASEARTKYGYLAEGEIRFIVLNPEALQDSLTLSDP